MYQLDDGRYHIHFQGWDEKHDLEVDLDLSEIAPHNTYVKPKGKGIVKVESNIQCINNNDGNNDNGNDGNINNHDNNNSSIVSIEEKIENEGNKDENNLGRRRRSVTSYAKEPVVEKAAKKPKNDDEEEPDKNDWVCSVCSFLESEDGSSLILCDGPCKRSFHLGCLDKKNKIGEGDWYCNECKEGRHICFVCKESGDDWTQVTKCSMANCGKYYHSECLTSLNDVNPTCLELKKVNKKAAFPIVTLSTIDPDIKSPDNAKSKKNRKPQSVEIVTFEHREVDTFTFKCPFHICNTCYGEYGRNRKGAEKQLFPCLLCPTAYHINCIAPGSRFNSMCLLCPAHPEEPLPSKDMTKRDLELTGNTIWSQIILPDQYPDIDKIEDGGHFRLAIQYKDDITSEVKQWTQIKNLDYSLLPNKEKGMPVHYSEECCDCVDVCGDNCLNRILKIECCEPSANNGVQICNVGAKCTNRRLQNQEYAHTEKFREHAMGWGLRAIESIKSGSLVIEYIGEVIDEAEMVRRMEYQKKYAPADHDFYVMELDSGIYVDGKKKGSPSRFINHSCDPNCELERTVVKGKMRIAIVAIKDIAPGEPLSYDYQFDTQDSEAFKCYCGNEICRGTMAPKKRNAADKSTMTNRERQRYVQLGKQILKKAEANEGGIARNYTGKFLPGDNVNEISSGPQKSTFAYGRASQLFLPRNFHKTSNFHNRRAWSWVQNSILKESMKKYSTRKSKTRKFVDYDDDDN